MATNSAVVTTSRIRTASQSDISCSTWSSEVQQGSSEEAFDPRDAVPSPSPARALSDEIVSCRLEDHPLDCQACRDLSKESGFPMHCLGLPYRKPSPRPNTSAMANEAVSVIYEPTSDPTFSRSLASLLSSIKKISIPSKSCHVWLGSLLGLGSLILAIVCLLMFTVRSYRMAVWTTRNDELQACIGLIQAERPVGPNCEQLISDGPQDPPYNLSRRFTNSGGSGGSFNLSELSVAATDPFLPVGMKHSAWLISASIFALISLADLLLSFLRHRCKTDYAFESLAAIEIATPIHQGQRNTMIDNDHADAWIPLERTDPSTSRTNYDFENLAEIELATLALQGQRNTINDHADVWTPLARTDLSMGIRRRTRLTRGNRQEAEDEISMEDQSVGEGGLPYSIARYLNQPIDDDGFQSRNFSRQGLRMSQA